MSCIICSFVGLLDGVNATVSSNDQEAGDGDINRGRTSGRPQGVRSDEEVKGTDPFLRGREQEISALQTDLMEKNDLLLATDDRMKSALDEVIRLRSELEGNADLLSECQVQLLSIT